MHHVGTFDTLEDQMIAFTPETARAAVEARTRRYRDALAAAGLPPPRRARPGAAKRQL